MAPAPSVARTRPVHSPGFGGAKWYFQTVQTYCDLLSTSCASCQVTPSSTETCTRLIPDGPAKAQPTMSIGAFTLTRSLNPRTSKTSPTLTLWLDSLARIPRSETGRG